MYKVKVLNSWPRIVDPSTIYVVSLLMPKCQVLFDEGSYICILKNVVRFHGYDHRDYEVIGKIYCYHSPSDKKKRDILFSVGYDLSFYRRIKQLECFENILYELRDLTFNQSLFEEFSCGIYKQFGILQNGTLFKTCKGIVTGKRDDTIVHYRNQKMVLDLEFNCSVDNVISNSVHAFIGRNGVGKTYLMNNMLLSLVSRQSFSRGSFDFECFSPRKVISVLWNQMDDQIVTPEDVKKRIPFSLIRDNYYMIGHDSDKDKEIYKKEISYNDGDFKETFACSTDALCCFETIRAFSKRQSELYFSSLSLFLDEECFVRSRIVNNSKSGSNLSFYDSFCKLSCGHKKIIMSLIAIINEIDDYSIVFFDEPEANLYPGLVTRYFRALKLICDEHKSIMFLFTHSPVIIQQLPSVCVWKMERNGYYSGIRHLPFETLGENLGKITRDAFDIETEDSIYYGYLTKIKKRNGDCGSFGDEAKSCFYLEDEYE